jgi:hypothetical protein
LKHLFQDVSLRLNDVSEYCKFFFKKNTISLKKTCFKEKLVFQKTCFSEMQIFPVLDLQTAETKVS